MIYDFKNLDAFGEEVLRRVKEVVTQGGIEVQRSVVEGSEITGAPGQPVHIGTLKGSFIPERPDPLIWQTTTGLDYAPIIEENLRGATLRSKVGGFHSVALTRAGWPKIVDVAVARVVPK